MRKTSIISILISSLSLLLLGGCAQSRVHNSIGSEPSIMLMTLNQDGWFRCFIVQSADQATVDWIISSRNALSAKDEIRLRRYLSTNEFNGLFEILKSDPRILEWNTLQDKNLTMDNGLLISLQPRGAFGGGIIHYDIDPTPRSDALITEIKQMLRFADAEALARQKN